MTGTVAFARRLYHHWQKGENSVWSGALGMRRLRKFGRKEGAALAVTLAMSLTGWAYCWNIWSPARLAEPVEYCCDAMFYLGALKFYGDQGFGGLVGAVNPLLAAPDGAHWNDFPMEDVLYAVVGLLGRVVGVIAALTLAALASVLLAATSMFVVTRRLRAPRPLAMLLGVVFSLTPFFHYRSLQHFGPALHWHVPLCILVWLWCSARGGVRFGARFWAACAIAAITATLNIYYTNYLMQVLLLIGAWHLVRRRWRAALSTFAVMTAGMLVVVLINLDTITYVAANGKNAVASQRNHAETILYALRPIELVMPPYYHRVAAVGQIGARYRSTAPMLGEYPSNYLGLLPLIAFGAMMVTGLGRTLRILRRGVSQRLFVFSLWLVFVAIGGGLMSIVQRVIGVVAFRSNNRVSILLLGLGLVFAARWLARPVRRLRWQLAWALAIPLAAFAVWEQSPDLTRRDGYPGGLTQAQSSARYPALARSDAKMTRALEEALPAGSGVFQLPVVPFPEAGGMGAAGDYEHFRLYLNSTGRLRFSYGAMKGRPEAMFGYEVAQLPLPQMVERLRARGFGSIVMATWIYPQNVIDQVVQAATTTSAPRVIRSEAGDWVAVLLTGPP